MSQATNHTILNRPFAAQMEALRRRLAEPLPGDTAHFTMAPVFRQNPALSRIDDKPCREAAVLALLFPVDDAPHLLLTARPDTMRDHAGQVSFPGGRREPEETLLETALREAEEEVGLPPADVHVLGQLTPFYIPPSNFCVHPFVGAVAELPDLYPHDEEVAAVLYTSVAHLLDTTTRRVEPWMLRGKTVEVPFFAVETYKVWGATAMMLAELLTVFREILPPGKD